MVREQVPPATPPAGGEAARPSPLSLERLRADLRIWAPSVRQGLLQAMVPGGRNQGEGCFVIVSERIGLLIIRDERWSWSPDDPGNNPDAMEAEGDNLASLLEVLHGVPIEEVAGLVGRAVLGLDADGVPGNCTWHPSYTDAQKKRWWRDRREQRRG